MIQGRRTTLTTQLSGRGSNGGSDAETFENGGSRAGVRELAGRRVARPKPVEYRDGDGYRASTHGGARRGATGDDGSTGGDDSSASGDDSSAPGSYRSARGDNHACARDRDEEKEVHEDDPAAGDR